MKKPIPKFIQPAVWSVPVGKFNLQKNKVYIIHQVLSYGTMEQIKWLFRSYSKKTIHQVFFKHPQKVYSPAGYSFVKNLIFGDSRRRQPIKYVSSITGRYPRQIPKSHFQKLKALSG